MSNGYVKLFSSILDSSVWTLSKEAKILWVTMLAMKGRDQTVRAALPALARRAVLTIEETQKGLAELMQPDPWSQTKEHEGRRVIEAPGGGWQIVTGQKYRDMLSKEERREYKRVWMANRRKKLKETAEQPHQTSAGSNGEDLVWEPVSPQ